MAVWWTNTSLPPPSGVMKPNPFESLNHFTLPVAIRASFACKRQVAASLPVQQFAGCIAIVGSRQPKHGDQIGTGREQYPADRYAGARARVARFRSPAGGPDGDGAAGEPSNRRASSSRRASRRRADLAEDVQLLERLARADHDRAERVLGEEHRQARLLAEQRIKALQERAAAREHDAAVSNVAGELGGRALERALHRLDDDVDRLGQRVADLVGTDGQLARHAGDQIASLDVHRQHFVARVGVADGHLDQLGRALADEQVVPALDVLDDRLVHFVAADAHAVRADDAGEADHRDVGRAAADVDDHVAGGLGDGQAGADGRGNGLLDQVDLAGARALGGLAYRAPLDLGDARGNADDDARLDQRRAVVRGPDEVAQHGRGDLEVGDDAVLHRPDGDDVPGRTPEHLLRLLSDREYLLAAARCLLHGHHAGLVGDDAHAADVDERVRGAEVDCEVP